MELQNLLQINFIFEVFSQLFLIKFSLNFNLKQYQKKQLIFIKTFIDLLNNKFGSVLTLLKKIGDSQQRGHNLKIMHRTHHPSFSLQYCLILENRLPLIYVPRSFTTYFINSKRRFFLYCKYQDELVQLVKIFQRQNVKFYQRKSIFPDRQENQEIVYHCNYKFIKKDLRWTLRPQSKPRQPRFRFNQSKSHNRPSNFEQLSSKNPYQNLSKNDEQNKLQSLSQFSKGTNFEPDQNKVQKIEIQQQTAPQFVANFGDIKIRNPEVLEIINNFQLIKALFKSQKRR